MSVMCRLGVHRWHYYYRATDWHNGYRRCTRAGCRRDEKEKR